MYGLFNRCNSHLEIEQRDRTMVADRTRGVGVVTD